MIQTSELRIGSIYKFLEGDCFSGETEPLHTAHFWTAHEYSEKIEDHVEGIPLTPEILEKCGFVKEGDFYYLRIEAQDLGKAGIRYMETRTDGGWCYLCGIDGGRIGTAIWHLHQLQNLYFALTGEELNYQL
jgi:hypothetical protein